MLGRLLSRFRRPRLAGDLVPAQDAMAQRDALDAAADRAAAACADLRRNTAARSRTTVGFQLTSEQIAAQLDRLRRAQ